MPFSRLCCELAKSTLCVEVVMVTPKASASVGALFIHRVASELQPEAHDLSYDIGG
jgi:hypothetical protein